VHLRVVDAADLVVEVIELRELLSSSVYEHLALVLKPHQVVEFLGFFNFGNLGQLSLELLVLVLLNCVLPQVRVLVEVAAGDIAVLAPAPLLHLSKLVVSHHGVLRPESFELLGGLSLRRLVFDYQVHLKFHVLFIFQRIDFSLGDLLGVEALGERHSTRLLVEVG